MWPLSCIEKEPGYGLTERNVIVMKSNQRDVAVVLTIVCFAMLVAGCGGGNNEVPQEQDTYSVEIQNVELAGNGSAITIDAEADIVGSFTAKLHDSGVNAGALHTVAVGLRDASGKWVGREPVVPTKLAQKPGEENGKTYTNCNFTLPTAEVQTSALATGLEPGKTYYLWVHDQPKGQDADAIRRFKELTPTQDGDKDNKFGTVTIDGGDDFYTLSISGSNGKVRVNGTVQDLPWANQFAAQANVTLEAIPDDDYKFDGWSGDLSGSTSPTSINIDGNKDVTANFSPLGGPLTVQVQSVTVASGANVTVPIVMSDTTGVAAFGMTINYDETKLELVGGDAAIVKGAAVPADALLLPNTLTPGVIRVAVAGTTNFNAAEREILTIEFKAIGAAGPTAVDIDDTAGAPTPFEFVNAMATAIDPQPTAVNGTVTIGDGDFYTLSISGSHGKVRVNGTEQNLPWSGQFASGSTVNLVPVPDNCYKFDHWSGGGLQGDGEKTITMDSNKSVTATFVRIKYKLTIMCDPSNGGKVRVNGTERSSGWSADFDCSSTVDLVAVPENGQTFTEWTGGVTGSAASASVHMDGDKTVTAHFGVTKYKLTIMCDPSNGGKVRVNGTERNSGWSGDFDCSSTVDLVAVPGDCRTFTGWTGGVTGSATSASVHMDGDKTVTAHFGITKYKLTIICDPSNGGKVRVNGTERSSGWSGDFDCDSAVNLVAVPNNVWTFKGWQGVDTRDGTAATVTMTRDRTVTAEFEQHEVTISGTVATWDTHQGVADVTVRIAETGQVTRTDGNGDYSFTVSKNTSYTVSASKKKYNNFGASEHVVDVGDTSVTEVDFEVAAVPMPPSGGRIYGFVFDSTGAPVQGVTATVSDKTDIADANGEYAMDLSAGEHTVTPSGGGYTFSPATRGVTVTNGQVTRVSDFTAN